MNVERDLKPHRIPPTVPKITLPPIKPLISLPPPNSPRPPLELPTNIMRYPPSTVLINPWSSPRSSSPSIRIPWNVERSSSKPLRMVPSVGTTLIRRQSTNDLEMVWWVKRLARSSSVTSPSLGTRPSSHRSIRNLRSIASIPPSSPPSTFPLLPIHPSPIVSPVMDLHHPIPNGPSERPGNS